MFKKTPAISLIVLFIGIIFISGQSFAAKGSDVLTGVTTGKRKIINHNIQQAKQRAVSDALNFAVQNAFAELVSRQVFASNLNFFYNQILSHTSDYIITYRVLGGIENKGHYLVGVESKVDIKLLEKTLTDARILNANHDKPVILFFIAEKTPSDLLPKYWWGNNPVPYRSLAEEIIISKMLQDRFIVTGNDVDRPDPSFYNIMFDSIYDIAAAKDLGREMKADMIVFGKASSSEAINRMGEEKTFNAKVNLEGYNLETCNKYYARFLTKNLSPIIPRTGIWGWKGNESFLFEMAYWEKGLSLKFVISPGNEKNRQLLSEIMKSLPKSKKATGKKSWTLYSDARKVNFTNEKYDDKEEIKSLIQKLLRDNKELINEVENKMIYIKEKFEK